MSTKKSQNKQTRPITPLSVRREEAAAMIGVGLSSFERYVAAGLLPQARQLGGSALWLVEELADCLRNLPTSSLLPPPAGS